jgi:hypothetical protein
LGLAARLSERSRRPRDQPLLGGRKAHEENDAASGQENGSRAGIAACGGKDCGFDISPWRCLILRFDPCEERCYKLRLAFTGGAVAQLGARLDGIEEVVGSNPIGSTIPFNDFRLPDPPGSLFLLPGLCGQTPSQSSSVRSHARRNHKYIHAFCLPSNFGMR